MIAFEDADLTAKTIPLNSQCIFYAIMSSQYRVSKHITEVANPCNQSDVPKPRSVFHSHLRKERLLQTEHGE